MVDWLSRKVELKSKLVTVRLPSHFSIASMCAKPYHCLWKTQSRCIKNAHSRKTWEAWSSERCIIYFDGPLQSMCRNGRLYTQSHFTHIYYWVLLRPWRGHSPKDCPENFNVRAIKKSIPALFNCFCFKGTLMAAINSCTHSQKTL